MTLSPELLTALRKAELGIEPHSHYASEWFAGLVIDGRGGGDVGPFPSAEMVLVAGVHFLVRLADTAEQESEAAVEALVVAREEVEALKRALAAAQAELRAEREAKGQ